MSTQRIFRLIAFLAFTAAIQAETFFGITSATNRLVVGTNEALIIFKWESDGGVPTFQLEKGGDVFPARAGNSFGDRISPNSPSALAGPCELIITNQALLAFHRLQTSAVKTFVLTPSATTNTAVVSVAAGRNIRIFASFPPAGYSPIRVSRGTNGIELLAVSFNAPDEFSGPVDLTFRGPTSGAQAGIYSYAITEDAQTVPQGVAVQSGTGVFQLELEKSTGLTNWSPIVIQQLRDDQKAYYRLRITK